LNAGSALAIGAPKSPVLKALRKVCSSLYGAPGKAASAKGKKGKKGKGKSEEKGGGFLSSLLGKKAS
jgi:hypothetical protein